MLTITKRPRNGRQSAITFLDADGRDCSAHQTVAMVGSTLLIGANGRRMHLTRAQVATLLPYLTRFVTTGDLLDA